MREARCFDIEELSMATKNFDEKNRIGFGKFGEVYKGLLQDGRLVAIKKRSQAPTQEFVDEVFLSPAYFSLFRFYIRYSTLINPRRQRGQRTIYPEAKVKELSLRVQNPDIAKRALFYIFNPPIVLCHFW